MSSEFTYPSFTCILEYLEANKRIHIGSRSKALQKIDKRIPLHIKSLDFSEDYISVNDIDIKLYPEIDWFNEEEEEKVLVEGVFRTWDQVLMPGDVSMKDGEVYKLSSTENLEIRNKKSFTLKLIQDEANVSRIPPDLPQRIAMKKAATVLFGGRSSIYVSEIQVIYSILRLPSGFNLRIRRSLNIADNNIDNFLSIIDPRSFPLKSITLCPTSLKNYHHQVVQTAETLEILSRHSVNFLKPWHEEVLFLPHKHIQMTWMQFDFESMIDVVQDWLSNPREHGKTLGVWYTEEESVERLYQIKKRFNGKVVRIAENNDKIVYTKAVIIPIDFTSELFIFIHDEEGIKLKSIPTGSIQSTGHANLTYLDVIRSNPGRLEETFKDKLAGPTLLFFFFMFTFPLFYVLGFILYHEVSLFLKS